MSLKPKTQKKRTSPTTPLAGVPSTDSLQKGKLRGEILVWEGRAKSNPKHGIRETFVLAYYPVKQKFTAYDGWADYDKVGWSNVGGKLTIRLEEYGYDTKKNSKGQNIIYGEARFIQINVTMGGTGHAHGTISLDNTPETRKYLRKHYLDFVAQARKAKTENDIESIAENASKLSGKHRSF
jgi:hypothetical protein